MKKIFLLMIIILFVVSCSTEKKYETPEEVINANIDFMNNEDIEGAIKTLHPESPQLESTEAMMKKIFEMYDLNYKIESMKVLEEYDDEARVEFVQVTTKIKGPDFKNNRITGIHTLKKDGDSWKIYSTEMKNLEFLDKNTAQN